MIGSKEGLAVSGWTGHGQKKMSVAAWAHMPLITNIIFLLLALLPHCDINGARDTG